jgi:hypothetical protein
MRQDGSSTGTGTAVARLFSATTALEASMKKPNRYDAMEELCRRHAELDKTTATVWLREADLWSKLAKVEQRLQILQAPDKAKKKPRLAGL